MTHTWYICQSETSVLTLSKDKSTCLSMTYNGLLFLTTSLVIQIYDLEHDSRCERRTVLVLKCFRRYMLLEICSKCEILLKCCPKCENVQNSAPNSKICSKRVLSAIGKGPTRNAKTKETEWHPLCCCHGNTPGPSLFLWKPNIPIGNLLKWYIWLPYCLNSPH